MILICFSVFDVPKHPSFTRAARPIVLSATVALIATSACAASPGADNDDSALTVAAAFYPLEYVAERVGGDLVSVSSLTPAGVEPHDVELSPAAVRQMGNADLVLYIEAFQPAVEDAIEATGVHAFDATDVIDLAEGDTHADDDHVDDNGSDGHDHGSADPHFWLDPTTLARYATAVSEQFAALDPTNAAHYRSQAGTLVVELTNLDDTFTAGLARCERRDIVTSHAAFGYLAHAYDLHQVSIAGIEPDTEPSPARLREIGQLIRDTGATTVFTEQLVSARVAEAVAQDTGVTTAVLDPLETAAAGDDYSSVMLRNLDALREALNCD